MVDSNLRFANLNTMETLQFEPKINIYKKSNPLKAIVLENISLTPRPGEGKRPKKEGEADIHRIILQVDHDKYPYLVGQSAGIIPPGEDPKKVEKGAQDTSYTVRLYSIASPSLSFGMTKDKIEFIIKRDNTYDEEGNLLYRGVCSNYMCDLKPGEEVQLTGPSGKKFLLPRTAYDKDIYFIATGTGIAPFFGMTEELLVHRLFPFTGKLTLIYGAPYSDEIVLRDYFLKIQSEYPQFRFIEAVSREMKNPFDGGKMYVTHRLREIAREFEESFQGGASVYICGGPKGMEKGIIETMMDILKISKNYEEFKKELEEKNQLFIETY